MTAAEWATLAVEIVKALAWPVTLLIVFFVLRKPIAGLIPYLEKLRYKDLEFKFRERLSKAEEEAARVQLPPPPPEPLPPLPQPPDRPGGRLPDYLYPMAATSPTAAVLEAWARIETEMRRRAKAAGLPPQRTNRELTRELIKAGILPPGIQSILEELRGLRNEVAHARLDLDPEDAIRYLDLGNRLLALLNRTENDPPGN